MENETPAAEGEHAVDEHAVDATDASGALHATTEAEGGHSAVFPPFDPAGFGPQLLWLAITFVVLYVVLSRLALPRIGGILETRKGRIDGDIAAADAARQKTDAAIASYEADLAEARRKSHALAEQTRDDIKSEIAAKRAAVEADLGAKLKTAEGEILASKQAALTNVGDIAAQTAEALVARLSGSVTAQEARDAVAAVSKE